MISKQLKVYSLLIMSVIIQIASLGAASHRYNYDVKHKTNLNHVTTTLINNTKYSLWLKVEDAKKISRMDELSARITSDPDDDENTIHPFGKKWLSPKSKNSKRDEKDAPEGKAILFYATDPGFFTLGSRINLNLDGHNSTASGSSDIKVTIEATPAYIFYEETLFSKAYIYEWYNYTIIVDPKDSSGKHDL